MPRSVEKSKVARRSGEVIESDVHGDSTGKKEGEENEEGSQLENSEFCEKQALQQIS